METTLRAPRRAAGPTMRSSVAAGLFLVAAGLLAMAAPVVSAVVAVAVFAWTSLFAGAVEITHAFEARRERQAPWYLLGGALYTVAGFLVLFRPGRGTLAVAMVLATLLVLRSAVLGAIAWQLRRTRVWALFGLDGLVSAALGAGLFIGWPSRAIMLVGLFVGASLMMNGVSRLLVAAALRSQNETRS